MYDIYCTLHIIKVQIWGLTVLIRDLDTGHMFVFLWHATSPPRLIQMLQLSRIDQLLHNGNG